MASICHFYWKRLALFSRHRFSCHIAKWSSFFRCVLSPQLRNSWKKRLQSLKGTQKQAPKLYSSWLRGTISLSLHTWDVDCLFRPYPSLGELEHSCANAHTCPQTQTIDLTECTSLIWGVPWWWDSICIISHLERDVLEASGGLMVRAGVESLGAGGEGMCTKCPLCSPRIGKNAL